MAHDLSVSLIRFGHITLAMKNNVLEAVRNIAARRQLWRREDDFVINLSRKGFGTVLVGAQGGGDPIAKTERVGAEVKEHIARGYHVLRLRVPLADLL
jgi:hypothetical protein